VQKIKLIFFIVLLALIFSKVNGQYLTPFNSWRSHLDYNNIVAIDQASDTIFVGANTGFYILVNYDKNQYYSKGYSKVDGFSNYQVTTLKYSPQKHKLLIGYQDCNIDIWDGQNIINIPEIKRYNQVIGVKQLTNVAFDKDFAYVSASFGIIKIDLINNIIVEDYQSIYPTDASTCYVYALAILNDSLYAGTNKGLISVSLKDGINLRDYSNWRLINPTPCRALDTFKNELVVGFYSPKNALARYNGTKMSYFNDTIPHYISNIKSCNNQVIVISDHPGIFKGFVTRFKSDYQTKSFPAFYNVALQANDGKFYAGGLYTLLQYRDDGGFNYYRPNGPATKNNYYSFGIKRNMYFLAGAAKIDYSSNYNQDGYYGYDGTNWSYINAINTSSWKKVLNGSLLFDLIIGTYSKSTGKTYIGSLFNGLLELEGDSLERIYTRKNSPINYRAGGDSTEPLKITGLTIDGDDNLWIANYGAPSPLIVKKQTKGKFIAYEIGSSNNKKDYVHIAADDNHQIWANCSYSGGITVFNYGQTLEDKSDDKYKELNTDKGNGNFPDQKVNDVVRDLDGQIWIATNYGVCYYPDPSQVFYKGQSDAQRPWVTSAGGPLLYAQIVNCIAVDGANRKWFGTTNGVFLFNKDGTELIKHFTIENSPLVSDNIRYISISEESGEVYFGSDLGIVSYRNDANASFTEFGEIYAYPNPVKPGYEGDIHITGLIRDCNVKIVDVVGKLVYETISKGGLATWNGCDFSGRKVNSGVYVVLLGNDDASKTTTTKILIVR